MWILWNDSPVFMTATRDTRSLTSRIWVNGVSRVEENKNPTFEPAFAKEPGAECAGSEQTFPKEFSTVRPAIKGGNFIDFPSILSAPHPRAI